MRWSNRAKLLYVDFPGALGVKRCPAIVISIDTYHTIRPDVILGLLTTQTAGATRRLMDYILQDWSTTDLHSISDFRAFLPTLLVKNVVVIRHLSNRDWQEVQARLRIALPVT